jgi:regulator of cell morphogenesis and NO signaling
MIQSTATLAQLARNIPAASRVFHRHQLDFCCAGQRTLADACAAAGLDVSVVATEIETERATAAATVRWDELGPKALVQHILDTYHQPLRPELQRLHEMARKVEAVHCSKASCPTGLADHLHFMIGAVEDHLQKEEQILFPMIVEGNGQFARMPIQVMVKEHDDHGGSLRKTRGLTNDLQLPTDACTTWHALYAGLEAFESDLMDHIHLENNVLFPMVLGR